MGYTWYYLMYRHGSPVTLHVQTFIIIEINSNIEPNV